MPNIHKYSFLNDYAEGCHPLILEKLVETNLTQEAGYGKDSFSLKAENLIRKAVNRKDIDVHLVCGGTQANLICLSAILKPFESVISADNGHILVHESGAIEATGHKINPAGAVDGKLTPELIERVLTEHNNEHMVKPKAVFISQSTEVGTIYSKFELTELSNYCRQKDLILYLDGARLASGLMAKNSDLSLSDIADLVDMFYIGGTKNGALLGEAIIIKNPLLQENFRYYLKQKGALLAKGRLLGIQFCTLFENNLYYDLGKIANERAADLTKGLTNLGFSFLTDSSTNQIFPILENSLIQKLQQNYTFYFWKKIDESHTAIRLVTSWATPKSAVEEFLTEVLKINDK